VSDQHPKFDDRLQHLTFNTVQVPIGHMIQSPHTDDGFTIHSVVLTSMGHAVTYSVSAEEMHMVHVMRGWSM
jgi:hypothetical protein